MKKSFILVIVFLTTIAMQASVYAYQTVDGDATGTRIYHLQNGLTVYLSQNKLKPEIQTMIAVRAGSQNDPLDATGMAHYQEHIMFKGTTHYGTTNYEAERPYLAAIDSLYEVYGLTQDSLRRVGIYHEIDSISYLNSKVAVANEFDKLMSVIGAKDVNAFTGTDMTCYHEIIPAGELERWAMIESDRFKNLVVRGFHTELETVYEEFNMNATRDIRKVLLAADQALYPDVAYRQHNTIGTQEHLKNPNLKKIKNFYHTWYRPNNVAICMSGDLDYDKTMAVIDQYFGDWEPNNALPSIKHAKQKDLPQRDTVVYGNESPDVWLAWKMPKINDEDMPVLEMMSSVMCNGVCGLIDKDLLLSQRVLDAGDYFDQSNDYSTYYMYGQPKDKQTLEQVRQLLLEQVEAMQAGKFDESLLKAIVRNKRLNEVNGRLDNESRTYKMLNSFIYGIPYADVVNMIDTYAAVTKEDIMRVARTYLTDSYVCVYKQQKEDVNPPKVDKPQITPIEMNRDAQSAFYQDILNMPAEKMQPKFLDFEKDIQTVKLPNGAELVYCQNKEDELFQLSIYTNQGTDQDPVLQLAQNIMDYKGTDKLSAEEYKKELYQLATYNWMSADQNETEWGIYGLDETAESGLQLLSDWVMTGSVSKKVLREQEADMIQSHEFSKSDQYACAYQLMDYGTYGEAAIQHRTLTPKQMKKLSTKQVLGHVKDLLKGVKRVEYFGPKSLAEVQTMLIGCPLLQQPAVKNELENRIKKQEVTSNEVVLAPYDANNFYLTIYQNWGEIYTPKDEVMIYLLNRYLGGDMSSIVFQEMRESRALCYASYAELMVPFDAGDAYTMTKFVMSQNDKLQDCIEAYDSIFTHMPLSQSAFDVAKTSLLKSYETTRIVRYSTLLNYRMFKRKGWDHDYREEFYQIAQTLTLEDVVKWYNEHAKNHPQRYLILGDEKQLDLPYLESIGTVKRVGINEIFGY